MKDPLNLLEHRTAGLDIPVELSRGDVIVESERSKISPLLIFSELIADQDIVETDPIEAPDEGAPDETGSPCHQDLAFF
jgi:hypothetical protein